MYDEDLSTARPHHKTTKFSPTNKTASFSSSTPSSSSSSTSSLPVGQIFSDPQDIQNTALVRTVAVEEDDEDLAGLWPASSLLPTVIKKQFKRRHQLREQQRQRQAQQVQFDDNLIDDNNNIINLNLATNKSTIKPRSVDIERRDGGFLDQSLDSAQQLPREALLSINSNKNNAIERVDASESNRVSSNSNCAIILKRTYILKGTLTSYDEWGEKFVFNEIDEEEKKKKIHKADLCIKHSDVEKAIEEAKHKIKFEKPDDLDSAEVSEKSIAAVAELNLAAGSLLTKKFDLSHDEILNALPMIDMSSSKFSCPKHVRPMSCSKSRYRTITGHCNNLKHPSWGASKTPYSRYLPPDYADGLTLPRASQNGDPLPSARLITSIVHKDSDEPSNDYNTLFASWGQLLNHDVTQHAVGEGRCTLLYD